MRKSAKLGLYGAVLVAVVGGTATTAYAMTNKKVAVSVDGQSRTIHTHAATVGGALKGAHIAVAEHDVLAPGASASVHDGTKVVLRKGRLLRLTIDGKERDVWTTATTVDAALAELGYGTGKTVSVSRSTRLPLSPTDISLLTLKHVTVKADGASHALYTGAATAQDAITQAGVIVGPVDKVSVALTSSLTEGQVVVVQRVRTSTETATASVPYQTTSTNDPNSYVGTTNVSVEGQNGVQTVTYALVYVDGKLTGKTQTSAVVTQAPVTQVQTVGTKAVPVATTPTTPTTGSSGGSTSTPPASTPPAATPPTSSNGLNWDAVAQCESSGNWADNDGSGFYGGLQFDYGTWLSNGGGAYAARADLATKAQQIAIANKLYAARGASPWPYCGRFL